jgi:ribose transport system permease protein
VSTTQTQRSSTRGNPPPSRGRRGAWEWVKEYPAIIIVVVLVVIFTAAYPKRFISAVNLTATLRQFVTLMLFSIGPSIVMLLGSIDQSFIGIWMLGSILLWLLTPIIGPVALVVFPLVGLATGALVGTLHTKGRIPSFILTLAILITYWGLCVLLGGGYPRKVAGYNFITAPLVPLVPSTFLWAIPIIIVAIVVVLRTRMGAYFYAIGSNEEGARLAGINVDRYKLYAFMLSGAFTGIGSIVLFGHLGGSAPVDFNMNNVVRPLVAIILGGTPLAGGRGGPHRTILGVFTFSILYRGLLLTPLRPELVDVLVGAVLVLSIIISSKSTGLKGVEVT